MSNSPYTEKRIRTAIEALSAIRENMDCVIELDRMNTMDKHEFYDDLASAIAYATQAETRLHTAVVPQ